jgi:hypothetical protein
MFNVILFFSDELGFGYPGNPTVPEIKQSLKVFFANCSVKKIDPVGQGSYQVTHRTLLPVWDHAAMRQLVIASAIRQADGRILYPCITAYLDA